jgi:hypothetical protein
MTVTLAKGLYDCRADRKSLTKMPNWLMCKQTVVVTKRRDGVLQWMNMNVEGQGRPICIHTKDACVQMQQMYLC